jgi:hypothetical protein
VDAYRRKVSTERDPATARLYLMIPASAVIAKGSPPWMAPRALWQADTTTSYRFFRMVAPRSDIDEKWVQNGRTPPVSAIARPQPSPVIIAVVVEPSPSSRDGWLLPICDVVLDHRLPYSPPKKLD